MPTDERERRDADTLADQVWKGVGYLLFAGLGYLEIVDGLDIPIVYQVACAFVAERRIAIELLRKHGGDLLSWLTRRGSS